MLFIYGLVYLSLFICHYGYLKALWGDELEDAEEWFLIVMAFLWPLLLPFLLVPILYGVLVALSGYWSRAIDRISRKWL